MHQELLTHHQVCFNESLKFKIPNIQFYGVPISIYLQETKSSYQHRLDQIQFVLHVCYFIFKKSCVPIFLILINKCTTFLLRSELSCYDWNANSRGNWSNGIHFGSCTLRSRVNSLSKICTLTTLNVVCFSFLDVGAVLAFLAVLTAWR